MPTSTDYLCAAPSAPMTITDLLPSCAVRIAAGWNRKRLSICLAGDQSVYRTFPTFSSPFLFSIRSQTSTVVLPGSSAGADRARLWPRPDRPAGDDDRGRIAKLAVAGACSCEMELRKQARGIHHRKQGRTGGCGLAREERPVGDDAGDRAANLRVAKPAPRRRDICLWPK